jgi:hypothetical protein
MDTLPIEDLPIEVLLNIFTSIDDIEGFIALSKCDKSLQFVSKYKSLISHKLFLIEKRKFINDYKNENMFDNCDNIKSFIDDCIKFNIMLSGTSYPCSSKWMLEYENEPLFEAFFENEGHILSYRKTYNISWSDVILKNKCKLFEDRGYSSDNTISLKL